MAALPLLAVVVLLVVYVPHAVALSVVDVREHRLPNRVVGSLTVSVLAVLGAAAAVAAPARPAVLFAIAVGLVAALAGIAIALVGPQLLGMGDAKTAPAALVTSAALGWDVLVAGLLGIAVVGGTIGIVLLVATRDATARFAYGPVLLAAPLLGLVTAPLVRGALGVG